MKEVRRITEEMMNEMDGFYNELISKFIRETGLDGLNKEDIEMFAKMNKLMSLSKQLVEAQLKQEESVDAKLANIEKKIDILVKNFTE